MSVGLDPLMTEVPDGKTVKIALEETPPESEDPADDTPTGWFADIKVDTTPAEMAQSIFDIVNAVKALDETIHDVTDDVKDIANEQKN